MPKPNLSVSALTFHSVHFGSLSVIVIGQVFKCINNYSPSFVILFNGISTIHFVKHCRPYFNDNNVVNQDNEQQPDWLEKFLRYVLTNQIVWIKVGPSFSSIGSIFGWIILGKIWCIQSRHLLLDSSSTVSTIYFCRHDITI